MTNCLLCAIGSGTLEQDLVVFKTENVFVVPTTKQRRANAGQVIVCPAAHVTAIHALESSLLSEVFRVAA